MDTTSYSFISIFSSTFSVSGENIQLKKIVIPSIQRDYAQGRLDPDSTRVRNRFLKALHDAIIENTITKKQTTFDFIYGDIDIQGNMIPLDGQQRLTTLFLLHWYAAKKENIPEEEYAFLKNFSYETRFSVRPFCQNLIEHTPSFDTCLSEEIVDQPWFPLDWKKNPTIGSMLVMLDSIQEEFKDVPNIWDALKNKAISFYFLPIGDMGLTDDLYIKMNSRGKPLTMFEHFKAELERELRVIDEATAIRIMDKIDRKWTDLLWKYRDSKVNNDDDNIIDDEFLRYFKFICDIICYERGESPQDRSYDEFDLLESYFSSKQPNESMQNILTMEKYFDCWCSINGFENPSDFLMSFMSSTHEKNKIKVDHNIDMFKDCLSSYSDRSGRRRQFTLNQIVLLYGIICYLQNQNSIKTEDFVRRIRTINNLIQNSTDEVSDRSGKNRIPTILKQVSSIIKNGIIDDTIESNFNVHQLEEEKEKTAYLASHPEDAEKLFELEDHELLNGQISIIGLDNLDYGRRFISLFNCTRDLINRALMSCGNYIQQERNNWRYQVGSSSNNVTMQYAWVELFHKSANQGFEKTKATLIKLLSTNTIFSDDILENICTSYLSQCEAECLYPWEYYFVKYPEFRPNNTGAYGKLSNNNATEEPYMYSVLQTKYYWSSNTYMPYLKAAGNDKDLSREKFGQRLIYSDKHIICTNSSYIIRDNETEDTLDTIPITQDENGIDTENRIEKLADYIKTNKLQE